ncbi:hypothetical protein HOY80DRAFT_1094325 [Tuber brumale]|nr:hypothetical protein HOY80DRAFT_1094325 [Tuber brumale]
MSIAAILKTSGSEAREFYFKDHTVAESSVAGAQNNDKVIIKTPPSSSRRKIKNSKKRSTSFLSPEGLTIKRGERGKRGKIFNFIKGEPRCQSGQGDQKAIHSSSSESPQQRSEKVKGSDSEWSSAPVTGLEDYSTSSEESSNKLQKRKTGKGKEVQY